MSIATASFKRLGGWLSSSARDRLPVRLGASRATGMSAAPMRLASFDQVLVWVTVALLAWGLVMVYSASIAMPDNPRFARYSHTHFLVRHSMWLCVSFVAALIAFQIPVARWEKLAPWLFVLSLVLLIAVLIPGIGKVVLGARRWISLGMINLISPVCWLTSPAYWPITPFRSTRWCRKNRPKGRSRSTSSCSPIWRWSAESMPRLP
jgi:cell division protein FtsW